MLVYTFFKNLDNIPDKYTTKINNTNPNDKYKFIVTSLFNKSVKEIDLTDSQINSSSNSDDHIAINCLFNNNDWWEPSDNDDNSYIEFNFNSITDIVIIDIMGKPTSKDDLELKYVTSFKLSYLSEERKWIEHDCKFIEIQTTNKNFIKRNY